MNNRTFNNNRSNNSRGGSNRGNRNTSSNSRNNNREDSKFPVKVRRVRTFTKFLIPKGEKIEYKNLNLLTRYLNDRGKISPRRYSGISASEQRQLAQAIKRARFLALLPVGGV